MMFLSTAAVMAILSIIPSSESFVPRMKTFGIQPATTAVTNTNRLNALFSTTVNATTTTSFSPETTVAAVPKVVQRCKFQI